MMNENLFQYIWQHALFQPNDLKTTSGESVVIIKQGRLNHNAGPDFLEAKIKIGPTIWVGNIELHLKTSDWKRHNHSSDPAYQNIILHVVLDHDIEDNIGNFSTLVLKDNMPTNVVSKYHKLMSVPKKIPCYKQINAFSLIKWQIWLNRLLAERWEEKLQEWENYWQQTGKDWRQLLYFRMAANFGFKVNKMPFLQLAQSLPLKVLSRHRNQLEQIEALIFGQSGLLEAAVMPDEYSQMLQKEYHFLRRKYELVPLQAYKWKFMRMRPANFPTIRLAQFAMLIHKSLDLFSKMMEVKTEKDILPLLQLTASPYWNNHYRFGEISHTNTSKRLGKEAIRTIIINTIAPMQFLYAKLQGANNLIDNSINLLQSIPPERNSILKEWQSINIYPKNASESQALIQLFSQYCREKKCLHCAVGHYLIKQSN